MDSRPWNSLTPVPGSVGAWAAESIGEFGTVGGLVPTTYDAYAAVHHALVEPLSRTDAGDPTIAFAGLRDVLARHTTSAASLCGQWEGFGFFGGGWHRSGNGPWERDPGVFGETVARTQRLALPQRDHVLFEGILSDLAPKPWRAMDTFLSCDLPSVFWPEDRAWFAATDTDLWVTVIGGTQQLVTDLLADPRLKVERTRPEAQIETGWVPVGERG